MCAVAGAMIVRLVWCVLRSKAPAKLTLTESISVESEGSAVLYRNNIDGSSGVQ